MVGIKKVIAIIGIFIPFFAIFLMSQNASALSVDNSYNQFYYSTDGITLPNHNYQWSSPKVVMNNQPCGSDCYLTGATLIQAIQISYENLTPQGNHATIHFEMNLTSQRTSAVFPLSNLHPYLDDVSIGSVVFYPNGGNGVVLNRETTSLNYAVTPFTANGGFAAETITFYGDITVSGVPTGSAGSFRINLSASPNYILALPDDTTTITYIEQNPTSFIYSSNLNDALLSQQIAQTEVLIQLQTDLQSQQNQNTQDIIDNQNENTDAIIKSNQNCRMSKNLVNIDDFTLHITNNRTFTYNLPQELSAGTYTLSYDYFSSNDPSVRVNVIYSGSSGQATVNLSNTGVNTFTANSSFNRLYFYITTASPSNSSVSLSDIMLVSGSSSSEFEPFGEEICKNFNQEYYDEQRQADQNISNQSSSDISDAENQATTNLIGVLSGFISAFSNINATNCNLTLEFPNYAGGTRIVNICSGKEKAPRIVEIGSSLLLIGVFVPLAYILIKMIYSEIRSWTNG